MQEETVSCVCHTTWTNLLEEALGLGSPKHRLVGEELFCRIYRHKVFLSLVIKYRDAPHAQTSHKRSLCKTSKSHSQLSLDQSASSAESGELMGGL